jgi:hypothetical protein
VESVTEFGQRISELPPNEAQGKFERILLHGLMDTKVGLYSTFHDNAAYHHGYGHPSTIRLAYMFTTCLDSAKTGLELLETVFAVDQKQYGRPRPSCMTRIDKSESPYQNSSNSVPFLRHKDLKKFILDSLVASGDKIETKHLAAYDDLLRNVDQRPDRDLMRPFEEAEKKAKLIEGQGFGNFVRDLEIIKAHVEKARESCREYWALSKVEKKQKPPDFAHQFAEGPSGDLVYSTADVNAIKASYAYTLGVPFALSVAFRDLCTIKAATSQQLPIAKFFAETMSIGSSFLRVLGERGDE